MALKQVKMRLVGTDRELHTDAEVARRNKSDNKSGKKVARQ